MATTAVVAEILAIGIQTLIWIGLAVFAFADVPTEKLSAILKNVDNWVALAAVAGLALAYSLGVMVDRIADSALEPLARSQKHKFLDKADVGEMRMRALGGPEHVSNFLEYIRGRLRLMRSTLLNAIPMTIFGAIFAARRGDATPVGVAAIVVAGLLLTWAAFFSWRRISETYLKRLREAYRLQCEREERE